MLIRKFPVEKLPGVRWLRAMAESYYERQLLWEVKDLKNVPRHVAVILDGNRRFAREARLGEFEGHNFGARKLEDFLEWCRELGIRYVTVFAFSTENFKRSQKEVDHLMDLAYQKLKEYKTDERIKKHKIRIRAIGDLSHLPEKLRTAILEVERETRGHNRYFLNVAIGYGGRMELAQAMHRICDRIARGELEPKDVDERLIGDHLYTAGLPDPDLIIRTSGEERLSGFLLWQSAYSELYFCEANWPAFSKLDFLRAIRNYQGRERRYGR